MITITPRHHHEVFSRKVHTTMVSIIGILIRYDSTRLEPNLAKIFVDPVNFSDQPFTGSHPIFHFSGSCIVKVKMIPAITLGPPGHSSGRALQTSTSICTSAAPSLGMHTMGFATETWPSIRTPRGRSMAASGILFARRRSTARRSDLEIVSLIFRLAACCTPR